ncbi:hypothetical protein M501DRAFT_1002349 [Patellaria atrata CBS 101060]|uniref:Uncharacterized protein n=1 Tax=Patellaria atrata CBS 101060 TaxID=1346257 RepID=A0A9P4SEC6_9PEZI|nr:hypothetical protein M501DRAFT_1002349 [Patellaria atrata CBS 101060]
MGFAIALPLNINLAAYSPALVVGDGEISLGGAESASELMEILASGAARNAANNGGETPPVQQQEVVTTQQETSAEEGTPALEGDNAARAIEERLEPTTLPNLIKAIKKRQTIDNLDVPVTRAEFEMLKRDLAGFCEAL